MSWDAPPPPGEPRQPAQWTQPQDGQYGGPYFPPYPNPNPNYPAPSPPPRRSRTGFYVAMGVLAVVVATGVAVGVAATASKSGSGTPSALGASSSTAAATASAVSADATSSADAAPSQSPHTVVVPASAGPLNLLSNTDTKRRTAKIASSLSGNASYGNPKIGFYAVGSNDSYSVWMLAEADSDSPPFRTSVNLLGDTALARRLAEGGKMTDVTTESPGSLGGALLCGKLTVGGSRLRVCEWVDDSTFGWVYFMPSVNDSDVLTYALDLRNAAEQ